MTAQFGKNHLGDADETLPTAHGFDEFFGSLYHLNAEEEFENEDYFKDPALIEKYKTRGVIHCWANPDGTQKIESTGPLGEPEQTSGRLPPFLAGQAVHGSAYDPYRRLWNISGGEARRALSRGPGHRD
jgi:hypothetical protein